MKEEQSNDNLNISGVNEIFKFSPEIFKEVKRLYIQCRTSAGDVYYLKEKGINNREIAHQACGKIFEKITRKDRATLFKIDDKQCNEIIDELNSQNPSLKFELILKTTYNVRNG